MPRPVSRRNVLQRAAAVGTGAAALLSAANPAIAQQDPAIANNAPAGRRFRALVGSTSKPAIMDVRMLELDENRVVVRTEASQLCYTIVGQSAQSYAIPEIFGHGGVGIVEAIGSKVRRVQVGDRVIV